MGALPAALLLARRASRVIRQNLVWAAGYNLAAMPMAALGLVPPWAAAIGMSTSSILVVLNSLRLIRVPRTRPDAPRSRPSPLVLPGAAGACVARSGGVARAREIGAMSLISVLIPVTLVLVGFGVWAFFWAVRSGQFDDLDVPAWEILVEERSPPEGDPQAPNAASEPRT